MQVGIGYSEIPDSAAAGKQAAEMALSASGREDACDMALLFCTARQNQQILREAVRAVIGASVPVYGGGAAGIITNDYYGYAGDQVGIVCVWRDGVHCDILTDGGLLASEEDTGFRLGQSLAQLGVQPDSSVMLLYDSIHRSESGAVRMLMATWILEGLKKSLGYLPDITGAGMVADHSANVSSQFVGNEIGENYAMAFMFDENIRVDSVIMHGCRPASPYYTVTKAEGPVILEINHRPALEFMQELLGPAIAPEQYPFFLLFGINRGERWGEYNEDNYASRLCLGIDPEHSGIVMFEADMVAGTEFQLMFRSLELDYMKPKIESLFQQLDGREPVFAMYIDCAGRCAGYGGMDMEDALVLQQMVAGRVPVFGIYTGVEIASIAGQPRGLDWTGVFTLFSQGGSAESKPCKAAPTILQQPEDDSEISIEAVLKLCEQNAAKIISLDTQSIVLRYELELKRRGFKLLSELAVSLRQTEEEDYEDMFVEVAQRINSTLNMQKTLVLVSDGTGSFVPKVLQGFTEQEKERLFGRAFKMPEELLGLHPVIVNAEDTVQRFAELRTEFHLPFFISSPIVLQDEVSAILMTGRLVEQPPYFSRLGQSDLETVHAIAELLGTVLIRQRLHSVTHEAETDGLTGLWNRNAFQRMVEEYLSGEKENAGAFMMIDVDNFKLVNDTHGHIVGDNVLKDYANAMRKVLRDTDIVGRQGGDEFVVFCCGIHNKSSAEKKAKQIWEACSQIFPDGSTKPATTSIGIAIAPQNGKTFRELYENADVALYKAKQNGRNGYVIFE